MLWTPEKEWDGEDAILIGGGASLEQFDWTKLHGKNTIGSNDAFRLGEDVCKICMFGDATWYHRHKWEVESFKGRVVSAAPSLNTLNLPNMLQLRRKRNSLHRGADVGWNFSTGAAAINLALNLGATRIFLIGYDLSLVENKSHWHNHRDRVTPQATFERFVKGFKFIADTLPHFEKDAKVIHVFDGPSKLPFFPCIALERFEQELLNHKRTEELAWA